MLKNLTLSILIVALIFSLGVSAYAKWGESRKGDLEGYIRGVSFIDENKGWAVGDGGTVLSTSNGGVKWDSKIVEEIKDTDLYTDLYDVHFIDEKNGWACGDMLKGAGVIIHTKDGGKTWDRQSSGLAVAFYGIFFLDAKNGWAAGANGTLLVTQSSGSKWTPLVQGKANAAIGEGSPGFWDVQFLTLQKGWTVGENGTIKMTVDGGKTWVAQNSGTDSNLSAVKFVNENAGWVVGEGGAIVATTDGGKTWTAQKSGLSEEWFYGVDFISDQEGFVVGDYAAILHTTDGGKTWKIERTGKTKGVGKVTFYDVSFPKPNVAFSVAQWGEILKYTP
ncbi:MAG: YCF48-related protein [Candidatus Poribacteria bacterium]